MQEHKNDDTKRDVCRRIFRCQPDMFYRNGRGVSSVAAGGRVKKTKRRGAEKKTGKNAGRSGTYFRQCGGGNDSQGKRVYRSYPAGE